MSFWKNIRELKRLKELLNKKNRILFYAESKNDWLHMGPVVNEIIEKFKKDVCYVTSDSDDPILKSNKKKLFTYNIGSGIVRTIMFRSIKNKIFIMTLTDLENYYLKKSPYVQNYVYIFHCLQSTHKVYTEKSFDNYDTILCAGPHHFQEIRKREKLFNIKEKKLFKHGYGRLDSLLKIEKEISVEKNKTKKKSTILLAPTWGDQSILEFLGVKVIDLLLKTQLLVVVRPHPMTIKRNKNLINQIRNKIKNNKNLILEENLNNNDFFFSADIMISDWSGVAQDFIFVRKKPVIFIETPKKIRNKNFSKLKLKTFEENFRKKLGISVSLDQIEKLPEIIEKEINLKLEKKKVESLMKSTVYNINKSASCGAKIINDLFKRKFI